MQNLGGKGSFLDFNYARAMLPRLGRRFDQLGLQVHPSSRYATHIRRLAEATCHGDVVHRGPLLGIRQLQQALVELALLEFMIVRLGANRNWLQHFQMACAGHPDVWDDENHLGRNTEFELYTAAALKATGCVVAPGEPDIQFEADGWRLAGAVKRLSSAARLKDRLKEGMKQIEGTCTPGLVFIDVSVCCLSRSEMINAPEAIVRPALESHLFGLVRESQEIIAKAASDLVLGAVLICWVPVVSSDSNDSSFTVIGGRLWAFKNDRRDPRAARILRLSRQLARVPMF